jgi:divalent metal cation (Fe/Co/Zn/Cd) transporter
MYEADREENGLPFKKNIPDTPSAIFRAIDNQSVNRQVGEDLIKRYGDRRVMEAIAELQEKMGIELTEEVGQRLTHIRQLIDEFHEKIIDIYPPPKKKKGKK